MKTFENRMSKFIGVVFYIAAVVAIFGSLVDLISTFKQSLYVSYINIASTFLVIVLIVICKKKIITNTQAFSALIIVMALNIFIGLFLYNEAYYNYNFASLLFRESILVLLLISMSSIFVSSKLSYIILIAYIVVYSFIITYTTDFYIKSSSFLIFIIFISYTWALGLFTNLLHKMIKSMHASNQKINEQLAQIQQQNEMLNNQQITINKNNDELILKNQQLEEQTKNLIELNLTKDKFFSIIGHDLKNPFNSIFGFSHLLSNVVKEKDLVKIEKYAKKINEASHNGFDLLINLLDWAKAQSNSKVIVNEAVEIKSVLNDVILLYSENIKEKKIGMEIKFDTEIELITDVNILQVILRNLISNAIKYTNTGGYIKMTITAENSEVKFSVADNGVGITENDLPGLFRIDRNYSTPGTNKEKGTGLGLILCNDFVKLLGGKIWVESILGKGSTFHFTIPCKTSN